MLCKTLAFAEWMIVPVYRAGYPLTLQKKGEHPAMEHSPPFGAINAV